MFEHWAPVSQAEWEAVQREHSDAWPKEGRTTESLRRKFYKLKNDKIPTGNPACPPEVRRAKHVYKRMTEKTEMSSGSDLEVNLEQEESEDKEEGEHGNEERPSPSTETPQMSTTLRSRPPSLSSNPEDDHEDFPTRHAAATTPRRPSLSNSEGYQQRDSSGEQSSSASATKRRRLLTNVSSTGSRRKSQDNDMSMKEMWESMMLQWQQDRDEDRERERMRQDREERQRALEHEDERRMREEDRRMREEDRRIRERDDRRMLQTLMLLQGAGNRSGGESTTRSTMSMLLEGMRRNDRDDNNETNVG